MCPFDSQMPLVSGRGEAIALIEPSSSTTLTYAQLEARVGELARTLAAETKHMGFVFCETSLPSVLAYLAALQAGHAVALLDASTPAAPRAALIEAYHPEFIFDVTGGAVPDGYVERAAGEGAPRLFVRSVVSPAMVHRDLGVLLSTSGSTGSPKFVRLSRRAVVANADSIAISLGLDDAERAIASLPFHYSYGLSVLNSHLHRGASVVLTTESLIARGFWDTFRAHQCTSFAGVPYAYHMLKRIGFDRFELPSLRSLTQAGGRLSNELIRFFHGVAARRGAKFFVMYGQTEATARISCLPAEELPERVGCVGRPLAGGRIAIEREGHALAAGEVGEVVYYGPNVMMGYAVRRSDCERGDDLGGRLATGDLGFLDADGFLSITGRLARMAKLFGLRINLDEVESMLRAHGPVAAVEGRENEIVLYCEFGDASSHRELRRELASALRIHHDAFTFRRVDALPLNANGKTDYERLRTA